MLALFLYALALSLPVWLFALISYLDNRKRGLTKATLRLRRCRRASPLEIDAHTAVLEAQYAVAPIMAIRELREQLRSLGAATEGAPLLEPDHECFERLLERLTKVERRRHAISV